MAIKVVTLFEAARRHDLGERPSQRLATGNAKQQELSAGVGVQNRFSKDDRPDHANANGDGAKSPAG